MVTLRERIGQMFLVGCQGSSISPRERLVFAEYQFGGFILFKRNCTEPAEIARLCRDFWDLAAETPPFIAIDQEGGRVHRLPPPFTHFPAVARIGAQRNADLARNLGFSVAEELKLIGVNLNFAPVLDVVSNPANPVIGDRGFGADPKRVIEIGTAWMQGLREGGIIPCGKHFPGHGDTDKDSHFELPLLNKSLDELNATELAPFAHLSRQRIESLMIAHVLYPALDANFPASLSESIVTGLLRQQFGYNGVVFSDDMTMKAISAHYSIEEATLRAVHAGVDSLLFCHDVEDAVAAFEIVHAEADRDPFLRACVEDSQQRILELKRRYLKHFTGVPEDEVVSRLMELPHRRSIADCFGS
jgi:beta-N-acetylhexosaminidase